MSRQTLKDNHNNIIGYVETRTDGVQVLKDSHNNIKGYYDPRSNKTKDSHSNIVGTGNTLVMLLGR